jgi:hypothetical protein
MSNGDNSIKAGTHKKESTLERHIPLGPVTSLSSELESPDVDILDDNLDRRRPGGRLVLGSFR